MTGRPARHRAGGRAAALLISCLGAASCVTTTLDPLDELEPVALDLSPVMIPFGPSSGGGSLDQYYTIIV